LEESRCLAATARRVGLADAARPEDTERGEQCQGEPLASAERTQEEATLLVHL
jgi:hypothetical protein